MQKQKRQRGVVLTYEGLQKLQNARIQAEIKDNYGQRYTLEQLSERTGLDINTIKKVLNGKQGVDKRTIERVFFAFNIELSKECFSNSIFNKRIDWGEAICTTAFYGRVQELTLLEDWLFNDRCQLVGLLGMGGIGKTSLSVKLAEQVQDRFEYVIWRSLREAPPIETILANLIQFLSEDQESEIRLPDNVNDRISRLIDCLRENRCLIILDNFESVLSGGYRAGTYQEGYEEYGKLLRLVGEISHKSCLVLTSREKPKEIASQEGEALPVRSLQLCGLTVEDGQELFKVKGLPTDSEAWAAMVESYGGNPLALKIVTTTIQDIFDGSVEDFLQRNTRVFGDINELIEQQFERLSDLEKDIVYWLAINREPVSLSELQDDIASPIAPRKLLEAVESLVRRSLVEKAEKLFTLQPVVMEYVTHRFVEQVCEEVSHQKLEIFRCHAVMKVTSKDYVREAQIRLIVKPVIDGLLAMFRSQTNLVNHLTQILSTLRETSPREESYTAGNIFNLLCYLGTDLTGYDFSYLTVWQADLRNVNLHDVNFAHANLVKCVFVETLGAIHSVVFSPDGQLLATGDTNGEIRLYQVSDGKQLFNFKGHIGFIWPVSFSPDGRVLASGSDDQTVKLWDTQTGQCVASLEGHKGGIWSVAFSPDGYLLASGSEDATVRLWDVVTNRCIKVLQDSSHQIWSVAFSSDGTMLATGNEDNTVKLWDINTGRFIRTLLGHNHRVQSVAFSPIKPLLASGCHDQTVRLWDISTGQCLRIFQGHTGLVNSIAFSSNGRQLATGSDDQTVKLWDIDTGDCLKTLRGHDARVWSVAFSSDGATLASGSDDQTVKLWDIDTGDCLKILQGYCNGVWSITINSQATMLASGSGDQAIRLWDINSALCTKTLWGHSNRVTSVSLKPDSNILASGSEDQLIKLWDINTGECLKNLPGHNNRVLSVAFSPDGKILASSSDDQIIKFWDISTGQCIETLQAHSHRVWSIVFSPDGRTLASASHDQTIRLWKVSSGHCYCVINDHTDWVWSVAFSPNGLILASGSSDQTIKLWDVSTGHCLKTLEGHNHCVSSVAFSSDGRLLASGGGDRTVKLWDVSTGSCLKTLSGHTKWVWSVAFGFSDKTLVSASEDATVKFWNIETGECLQALRSPRPYEGMNIDGVTGVTEATVISLKTLGAVDSN